MNSKREMVEAVMGGDVLVRAEERLKELEPLLQEVARRADKMGIDDNGLDFTVTIDSEMWLAIKDSL